jgi:multiple sugar transport system permease protein
MTMRKRMALTVTTNLLKAIIILIAVIFFIGPILWMIFASFKYNVDIVNVRFLTPMTAEHYQKIIRSNDLFRYLLNSLVITVPAVAAGLLLGVPVAYAISRANLTYLSPIILIVRMAPGISLIIPWYLTFRFVGILGTHLAVSLSHVLITAPLLGWILVSFFDKIPVELEEAAIIDGCSRYSALTRIVLPLVSPGLFSSMLLAFTWSWNNFLFALVMGSVRTHNMPLLALQFRDDYGVNFGGMFCASTVITLPAIIIAIVFQDKILQGMAGGALKG